MQLSVPTPTTTRRALRPALLAAVVAVAASCEPRPATPLSEAGAAPAASPDTLRIDGSAGVRPLVEALAREYGAQQPGVTIIFGDGLGSRARIAAVAGRQIDIAMASHGVDVEALGREGLTAHEIARVAVVFGVHESVGPVTVTEQQICDLYVGRVRSWRELGGADLPVVLLARPEGEVDADVVAAGVECFPAPGTVAGVRTLAQPDEMAGALAATPGAVGMTSLPFVQASDGRIRALPLDGVEPTPANLLDGTHALTRQSFLIVRHDEPSPAVDGFLAFVRSEAGARLIEAGGAVPLP